MKEQIKIEYCKIIQRDIFLVRKILEPVTRKKHQVPIV